MRRGASAWLAAPPDSPLSAPLALLAALQGVLYLRQDTGGGLSAGAIAGIAVGAAAGVAALACAAWMLVRRRRRRRAADALPGKAGVEGGSVSTGPWPECDPGSPAYQQQQQQQHVELQPAEQQQVQSVWLAPARASSGSLLSPFAAARRTDSAASSEAAASAFEFAAAAAATSASSSAAASTRADHSAAVRHHSVDVVPPLHTALSRRLPPATTLHHAGSRPPLPPGGTAFDEAAVAAAAAAAAAAQQGARAGSLQGPTTPSEQGSRIDITLPHFPPTHRQPSSPQSDMLGHQPSSAPTSASGMLASAASALGSTAPIAELVQHVAAQVRSAFGWLACVRVCVGG